jgi:alpha-D-ribose 1-methylphosphonate 5-triphosphate synthase subunit PhnL
MSAVIMTPLLTVRDVAKSFTMHLRDGIACRSSPMSASP